ncbi:hypothetical protein GCM10022223_53090 [Kineosporia mesophila]|uniref:Nuclear transport factor 2 family protein n=1 Tax=Kineosporia mesophila TaxID=566012 RepID=A0ABP7ABS1_9ACTN|nr:hypothetical protein [Kineosporia mesophila]MCD5351308.1 hypothetical protein [Kineosporia mesophila]
MPSIAKVLHELLNEREQPLPDLVSRYFAADYRQRTDGRWDDLDGFLQHMTHLRAVVASAHVEVLDELSDDRRYADRHLVTITKRDGSTVTQEVYLFAELAPDGRFRRIEETTLMLAGAESDRGIGSAH